MIKYLKGYIKQVGTETPTTRYIQNDFDTEPSISEQSIGVYNFNLLETFKKGNVIPYSFTSASNWNNYTLSCEYNTNIDNNSNIILNIENYSNGDLTNLSDYLFDEQPELYFEIGIVCEENLTQHQKSVILQAQSILVEAGLEEKANLL